jgi:hypothetical protein
MLRVKNEQKFIADDTKLGVAGNVVEADESRFKRHGNVGRVLRAGWFFGVCERMSGEQRREMTPLQIQEYTWNHTVILSVPDRTAATLNPLF